MHRHKRLTIDRETIRQLSCAELKPIAGGGSAFPTCSICLAGCSGGTCAAGTHQADTCAKR